MNERDHNREPADRDPGNNRLEGRSSTPNDLPESENDRAHLQPEETFIDLPDVKDIPGQEFVHVPAPGELGDTTIASADEEGTRVFDRDDSQSFTRGTEADVRPDERAALRNTDYMPTTDEDNLYRASMDSTDFQGEALNERSFGQERSGSDLDVPGASDDDRDENIGEEDEENNNYSLGSADNDNVNEGTP